MTDPSLRSVEKALERITTQAGNLAVTAPWVAGFDRPVRRGGYDGGNRNSDPTDGGSTAKSATAAKLAEVRRHRKRADQAVIKAAVWLEKAEGAYAEAALAHDESYGPNELGDTLPVRVATQAEVAFAKTRAAYRASQRPKGMAHGER